MTPPISIVIPTWNGADVIEDAIRCAQAQTLAAAEIIVAVDLSDDDTLQLAEKAASTDKMINVVRHGNRVGWVRNVNAALDRVRGDFFFLYFHDDLIDPTYLSVLFSAMRANPSAMSAYVAVEQDSGTQVWTDRGRCYQGGPLQRMLDRLLLPDAGAPLRALTRSSMLENGLRFPAGSQRGFHAQHAYLLHLMGAGDSIYVDEPLYRRRNWREGALTKSWSHSPIAELLSDLNIVARSAQHTAFRYLSGEEERLLIMHAMKARLLPLLRQVELQQAVEELVPASALLPEGQLRIEYPERWRDAFRVQEAAVARLEQAWRASKNASA